METSPTKAPVRKQLIGAVFGMGIAAVIYGSYETVSNNFSLSALLIDTPTISENANQVRVSNKNVDDEELRLIATRARQVAALQQPTAAYGTVEIAKNTDAETIVTRTEERRLRRFENDGTPVATTSPVANEETHGGAPLQTQAEEVVPNVISNDAPIATSAALPSSGFGTTALMVLALLGTAAVTKKKIFSRA